MPNTSGRPSLFESFGPNSEWSGYPNVIGEPDSSYMTSSLAPGEAVNVVVLSKLGLAMPADAVIVGFLVEVAGMGTGSVPLSVQLYSGLVGLGSAKSFSMAASPGVVSGGGAADLWGQGVAPARATVVANDFGVGLSFAAGGSPASMSIDAVRVTVYYTSVSGGGSSKVNRVTIGAGIDL